MNKTTSALLLALAAAALDCWRFSGALAIFHHADFTLCVIAALAVFAPETPAAAACFAGGLILDALAGKVLFLPLFFAAAYCIRGLGGMFYKPGSIYHLAVSMLTVCASIGIETCFAYLRAGAWAPPPAVLESLILNSLIFLCCAVPARLFRDDTRPALIEKTKRMMNVEYRI